MYPHDELIRSTHAHIAKISDASFDKQRTIKTEQERLDYTKKQSRRRFARRLASPLLAISVLGGGILAAPKAKRWYDDLSVDQTTQELSDLNTDVSEAETELSTLEQQIEDEMARLDELNTERAVVEAELNASDFEFDASSGIVEADEHIAVPVAESGSFTDGIIRYDSNPDDETLFDVTSDLDQARLFKFDDLDTLGECAKIDTVNINPGDVFVVTRDGGENRTVTINPNSVDDKIEVCLYDAVGSDKVEGYNKDMPTSFVIQRIESQQS